MNMLFTTLILGSLSAISLAVAIPDDDGCKGKTKTVTTTTLNTIISTQTISSLVTTSVTLTTTTTDSITTTATDSITTTATESITVTTTTTSASITTVTAVPSTFPTPVAYGSGCFYLIGAPTYLTGPDFPSAEHGCIAACNALPGCKLWFLSTYTLEGNWACWTETAPYDPANLDCDIPGTFGTYIGFNVGT